jgi:hypothetical protein
MPAIQAIIKRTDNSDLIENLVIINHLVIYYKDGDKLQMLPTGYPPVRICKIGLQAGINYQIKGISLYLVLCK